MKALVVYESLYGNTAKIGEAIATSLRARGLEVAAVPVPKIEPAEATGVDLLVVGGPTHVHGMSRSSTRRTAADDKKNSFAEPTVAPACGNGWTAFPRRPSGSPRPSTRGSTSLRS